MTAEREDLFMEPGILELELRLETNVNMIVLENSSTRQLDEVHLPKMIRSNLISKQININNTLHTCMNMHIVLSVWLC